MSSEEPGDDNNRSFSITVQLTPHEIRALYRLHSWSFRLADGERPRSADGQLLFDGVLALGQVLGAAANEHPAINKIAANALFGQ